MKSDIKNLSKNYVVVLCEGTLDVAKNNVLIELSLILQFVKNTEHTNTIIVDAPHGFVLESSACVNKEISVLNRKWNTIIIKPYEYTSHT